MYINTDNSAATGGYGEQWSDADIDVMLEGFVFENNQSVSYNPAIAQWQGTVGGDGWNWGVVTATNLPVVTSQMVGNRIEMAEYNSDGSLKQKDLCRYDSLGNMIELASYNSDGSLEWKDLYKYDSAGNVIERTAYNSDGSLISKYLYEYDSVGNKIESAGYSTDGGLDYKSIYNYDSAGNIVKLASYKSEIMIPDRLIEYEIVYRE